MNIIGLNQKEIAGISGGNKDDQSNSYIGYAVAAALFTIAGASFLLCGRSPAARRVPFGGVATPFTQAGK